MASNIELQVSFRHERHSVLLSPGSTLGQLGRDLELLVRGEAAYETIKLVAPGLAKPLHLSSQADVTIEAAGLKHGTKAMLLGSRAAAVAGVHSARELAGLTSFDHELQRAALRRRGPGGGGDALQPPRGQFTFGSYEPWNRPGLYPPPSEALKLLYRLANDRGIQAVMAEHRWSVGLLSEMPPEGKVGISAVCVLGYNVNAGQEISLRLRTDDLRGFRKYERIRETLIHELAHMVYGEHDNNFKALNSQLTREVMQAYAAGGPAHRLDAFFEDEDANEAPVYASAASEVMRVTSRSSGLTLRQLAARQQQQQQVLPAAVGAASTGAAASGSASAGAAAGSTGRQPGALNAAAGGIAATAATSNADLPGAPAPSTDTDEAMADACRGPAAAVDLTLSVDQSVTEAVTAVARESGSGGDGAGEEDAGRQYEHYDDATERAEIEMRRLGSLVAAEGEPRTAELGQGQQQHEDQRQLGETQEQQVDAGHAAGMQQHGQGTAGTQETPFPQGNHHHQQQQALEVHSAMDVDTPVQAADVQPAAPGEPAASVAAAPAPAAATSQPPAAPAAPAAAGAGLNAAVRVQLPELQLEPLGSTSDSTGSTGDDVAAAKYAQAWSALRQLVAAAADTAEALAALQTLASLLRNIVEHPGEDKYKQVRLGNAAFQRKAGRLPGAVEFLKVAGFAREGAAPQAAAGAAGAAVGAGAAAEQVLRYRRNDAGLLWLMLSALQAAEEVVRAAGVGR